MKREEDLDQSLPGSQSTETIGRSNDSTFGVQSLADTLEAAFGAESTAAGKRTEACNRTKGHGKSTSRAGSHSSSAGSVKPLESSSSSPVRKLKRKLSHHGSPVPFTLPTADTPSPVLTSAIPSPPKSASVHSLKLSDEESALDDVASQAITSGGEEEDADVQEGPLLQLPTASDAQYTDARKEAIYKQRQGYGQTEDNGVGKTSLIRSIVQLCEDIVHVDPLSPSQSFSQPPPPKSKSRKRKAEQVNGTTRITEIHASTKPYPHWWTDVEESRVLRRRKSSIDTVLERNVCFVDTPGCGPGASEKDDMNLVVDYVESLLYQTSSIPSMEDGDVLGVVSGNGGVSIDVVLYLLPPNHDISKDVEFMHRLSFLTNVIPVIAKADTLSAQEAIALKTSILARLQTTSVKPFFFGKALDDALLAVQGLPLIHSQPTSQPVVQLEKWAEASQFPFTTPTYPYAISSTPGPDNENMDASLLMSPDYVQPLLPSELAALVNQVFDPESIAWLRHSAAKKFLAWRRRTQLSGDSFMMQGLQQPRSPTTASLGLSAAAMNTSSIFSAASPSGVLVPRSSSPFYSSNLQSPLLAASASLANSDTSDYPTEFPLTRYTKYTQGEQRLSEVSIAKWATDLQRSLRNERERFEDLQRNDRAKWLLERVGEEVSRGTIVTSPGGSPRAEWAVVRHGDEKASKASQRYNRATGLDSRDPLGLCNFSDDLRKRGFVLVKVLGGMSVLGAIVVGIVRAFGMETGLPQGGWWSWLTGGTE
ncbi:hypothetical protein N0V83_002754 [Neocucurbitaria cava]|uniref:Septin-type G domain-containing protein n=1 Tax=Neocucurbitaria cava TaxID=798079 RepID=A0A9W8YC46_9PLEO|nr:hypothetical protein N0V83_002754 [Neocucurbitaria cava]